MEIINNKAQNFKIFSLSGGLLAVLLVLLLFTLATGNVSPQKIQYVSLKGEKIKVELALSDAQKEQGLSGRKDLPWGTGMFFVFERSGSYPFWMKDMNFPIDIIWINKDLKIVYIKSNASPESYPAEIFDPQASAKYVLEVPAGYAQNKSIKTGDRVKLVY